MIISKNKNIIKIKSKSADLEISPEQIKIGEFIINSPGEYEVQDIFVQAIGKKAYVFVSEFMKIGYVNKAKLSDKELEEINNIDILLTNSKNLVNQIEPRLVIFIKDIQDKINLKKSDLPKDDDKTKIWKN